MEQTDPLIGRSIGGKYELLSLLGKGGMGTVYKAEQTFIGRQVALKLLRPKEYESNIDEYLQRFRREAQTASQIRHPSAITIYDYGVECVEGKEDLPYLAMEFIEGKTLKEVLKETGTLPLDRIIPIMAQVCGALHEAHLLGIVHRDLKPDNIMISKRHDGSEWAHVLDFGIAKVLTEGGDGEEAGMTMTRTGSVIGTPRYMSPEQVLSRSVDQKTDIYSLGIIMYELLSGKAPFDAASFMEVAMQHINEPPKPLKDQETAKKVPDAVAKVVMKALEKDPANRPKSAKEFSDSLINASNLDFSSISTDSFSLGGLTSSGVLLSSKKKKFFIGGAVVATVGLISGFVALSGGSSSESDSKEREALMSELNGGEPQLPDATVVPPKSEDELKREAAAKLQAKKLEKEASEKRKREEQAKREAERKKQEAALQRQKELDAGELRLKQEQERLVAEAERLRLERLKQDEREAAAAIEAENKRLERLKAEAEAERIRVEQEEADRKLREETARIEKEREEAERLAKEREEAARLAKEREEAERLEKERVQSAAQEEERRREEAERARKAKEVEATKTQEPDSNEGLEAKRREAAAAKQAAERRAAEQRAAEQRAAEQRAAKQRAAELRRAKRLEAERRAAAERARIERERRAEEEAAQKAVEDKKKRRRLCGPPFARRVCSD
jgi:serine/threonine-protein kinase